MAPGIKKLYYSIREVAKMTEVEAHVLRFWEKEFPMLRPRRGRSGNRIYKERDIQMVWAIKDLLWDQKYTIQGAVEKLKSDRSLWEEHPLDGYKPGPVDPKEILLEVRTFLQELKTWTGSSRSE